MEFYELTLICKNLIAYLNGKRIFANGHALKMSDKTELNFRTSLALKINQYFFFGWLIVFVAMVGIFTSGPGQSHTFSVFIGPIAAELGISQTVIATAYGVASLVAAFCLPPMGRFIDRIGARRMLTIVAAFFGAACVSFCFVGGTFWLALGFAVLRFLGQGSLMLVCSYMVSQWFSKRRGFALGIMALGFGISMAIHPALSKWLIDLVGWREAWVWLGMLSWALLLPPVIVFVVSKPEDVGLSPDGVQQISKNKTYDSPITVSEKFDFTLQEALLTPTFYLISVGLFTLSMLVTTLHFFQVSLFADQGLDADIATTCFAVSAVTMVVMMPVVGRMLDQIRTERMFAGGLLMLAFTLIASATISNIWSALIYALLFGATNALTMNYFAYLWPRYFGRTYLGGIQGFGQTIGVVGASLGPIPLGFAKDKFGAFDTMLVALAILPIICAATMILFLRQPKRR